METGKGNIHSDAQWVAKNVMQCIVNFYLSRYKQFMSFKALACLGESCQLGEKAFCLLLTN